MKCYHCCNPWLGADTEACDNCGALAHPPAIRYFYVHPLRFVLLHILTLGLFSTYYLYKNWQAIKKAEKSNIHPLGRAVFHIFFCYSLFTRIYSDARAYHYNSRFTASSLIVFYMIGLFFSHQIIKAGQAIHTPFFSLGSVIRSFIALLPLLLIQPTIKYYNDQVGADYIKN